MENIGTIMEQYFTEMEERIRTQILEELTVKKNAKMEKVWLNKTELGKYLGVSFNTLDKFMKANPSFPSHNIAGAIRFNCHQVDEWMVLHEETPKRRKARKPNGE